MIGFIRIDRTLERLYLLDSFSNGRHILRIRLPVFQHQTAHRIVHLVLRSNAGGENALLIECDLARQVCKFLIFQKLTDHGTIYFPLIKIDSCFHR